MDFVYSVDFDIQTDPMHDTV